MTEQEDIVFSCTRVGHKTDFLHKKADQTLEEVPREVMEPLPLKLFEERTDMALSAMT